MKTKFLFITSILVLAFTISACGTIPSQGNNQQIRNLNINGNGSTDISPDIAYVNVGVHSEANTVQASVTRNNSDAQKVMKALSDLGVKSEDLRTSNFSIYSVQKYDEVTGELLGTYYAVDNNIIVTVRDLSKLGTLLDSAVKAGANSINNVQFDLADHSAALKEARDEALSNAINQAKEMADAAGIKLGDIQTIYYYDYVPSPAQPVYMDYGKGGGGDMSAARAEVPINPGQVTITATVTIVYALK